MIFCCTTFSFASSGALLVRDSNWDRALSVYISDASGNVDVQSGTFITWLTYVGRNIMYIADRIIDTDNKLSNMVLYTQNILDELLPLAGDNKTIAQQIYNLRNLVSAVGGQVADVSSKLITSNNYLDSISNSINNINNIDWIDLDNYNGAFTSYNGTQVTSYNSQLNYSSLYFSFTRQSYTSDIFRFTIPVVAWDNRYKTNFISNVSLVSNNGLVYDLSNSLIDYDYTNNVVYIYIDQTGLFSARDYGLKIDFSKPFALYQNGNMSYLPLDSLDHYIVSYRSILNNLNHKFDNFDCSFNVNVEVDNSDVVQAIDNLDLVNNTNDISIDVDLNINDGVAITNSINKFKDLFNTGISIAAFITSLDLLDNFAWFTPTTYSIVNPQIGGYKNLY